MTAGFDQKAAGCARAPSLRLQWKQVPP
jgi:hypothetical protein